MQNWRILYNGCPLCEGVGEVFKKADCSRHPLYKPPLPSTIQWMKCTRCGHVYTDGYYSNEALNIIFSGANSYQSVGANIESDRYVWAEIVDRVSQIRREYGGLWIDVGFGNGNLLFTALEFGYRVLGIDLRPENVAAIRQLGLDAMCVDFLELELNATANVISFADVLEHMPYPISVLQHAHRLLGEGGILFLSMPNIDSPLWSLLDFNNVNPYWGEIEHYHNFGRRRVIELLHQCGFRPVHYYVSRRYRVGMEIIAINT